MQRADGQAASCERCGAPLALAHRGEARCLFCLHHQALPEHLATPLREDEALAATLDAQEGRVAAQQRSFAWSSAGVVALFVVSLPPILCVGFLTLGSAASMLDDPLAAAMFATLGLGGLAPAVAIPVLWLRVRGETRARVLAALPVAVCHADGGHLTSTCPGCGAAHDPEPMALTVTCGSCTTEALLPLALVDARLARRHAEVLAARARGDAEADAARAAVITWQRRVVPAIFGFCSLFGVVIFVFVCLASLR